MEIMMPKVNKMLKNYKNYIKDLHANLHEVVYVFFE